MASISNPKMSTSQSSSDPGTWTVKVEYDAVFSSFELANFTYRDGFVLWEDDPSSDDMLTVGVSASTTFNPSKSPTHRTMSIQISEDALNTELGDEELYAEIHLRNVDLNLLQTRKTPVLEVAP